MADGLYDAQGALSPTVWDTNPNVALMAAMRSRGLFGALAMREQAALDKQRNAAAASQRNALITAAPQDQILSPADLYRFRAQGFANQGMYKEAGELADLAKKLDNDLEFKDGVWYDKKTGKPVRGGAFINQQGFGGQMNVADSGQISVAPLPGASQLYGTQAGIGEAAKAQYDLQRVPASSPTTPPTFRSRLDLLQGNVPAGMSPQQESQVAADAAQQTEVSKNYATMFNNLQNASMQNPTRISKLQQVGALLGDFEGGKFSKSAMGLAQAMNSAGIKIDPRLPNKEAAEAIANEIALELRSPAAGAGMPGAMSDKDREFLKAMTPQMSQTAEGRRTIIESRVKIMERENKVASMARQYRQRYGKLDESFFSQLQEWSNRNPVFKK